jgi:hypothetical protein
MIAPGFGRRGSSSLAADERLGRVIGGRFGRRSDSAGPWNGTCPQKCPAPPHQRHGRTISTQRKLCGVLPPAGSSSSALIKRIKGDRSANPEPGNKVRVPDRCPRCRRAANRRSVPGAPIDSATGAPSRLRRSSGQGRAAFVTGTLSLHRSYFVRYSWGYW